MKVEESAPPSPSCCCGGSSTSAATADVRTERQLIARVSELGSDRAATPLLEELLAESHPLYDGRGAAAVTRMRGWLLLALGVDGLAESSLPFVLEELESGHDAYLTAAAARSLRRFARRRSDFVPALLAGLLYLRYRDDLVSLSEYGGYGVGGEKTTAVSELLESLAWLGGAARSALPRLEALRGESGLTPALAERVDRTIAAIKADPESAPAVAPAACCSATTGIEPPQSAVPSTGLARLELQDQSGVRLRFGDFFHGRPSIVVFFYTRCDNPAKCQLTVTRLGRIQRQLRGQGLDRRIRTAAITYDPGFDHPERLARYAATWGVEPDADHRMLRTVGPIDELRAYFDLGVNYLSSLVNRHQIEAFVLDAAGRIRVAARRRQLVEAELVERARALLEPEP